MLFLWLFLFYTLLINIFFNNRLFANFLYYGLLGLFYLLNNRYIWWWFLFWNEFAFFRFRLDLLLNNLLLFRFFLFFDFKWIVCRFELRHYYSFYDIWLCLLLSILIVHKICHSLYYYSKKIKWLNVRY